MRITVVGLGHVGLPTAACLAHLGHQVVGMDADPDKLRRIGRGETPFFEPGLADLPRGGLSNGRFAVAQDLPGAARHGEVAFICVGTPIRDTGEANLTFVEQAARDLANHLEDYTVLAEKSTVPVGTGEWIRRTAGWVAPGAAFDVRGLSAVVGDPDGRVGEIVFPTLGGQLREDLVDASLGMPRDPNGDGVIDSSNHANDYQLLPVLVRLRWKGIGCERSMEVRTLLANR